MTMAARLALIAAASATAASPAAAVATTAPGDAATEEALQATLDEWRGDGNFAAMLSVRVPGGGDIHVTSGREDRLADGSYGIASVTKTFTTALALQLVEEGRLSLDQPVAPWLPELPNADRITLEMLLGHTSGLASEPDAGDTPTLGQPPVGEPGERFSYSNAGFAAVGQLIEGELEQDLAAVLAERLTGPLGLDDTLIGSSSPGWGMVSSSEDLLDWGEALYTGDVLGEDTTATMLEMRNPHLGALYGLSTMGICLDSSQDCTPDNVELVGNAGLGGVDGSITLLVHHGASGATAVVHADVADFDLAISMVPLVVEALHQASG